MSVQRKQIVELDMAVKEKCSGGLRKTLLFRVSPEALMLKVSPQTMLDQLEIESARITYMLFWLPLVTAVGIWIGVPVVLQAFFDTPPVGSRDWDRFRDMLILFAAGMAVVVLGGVAWRRHHNVWLHNAMRERQRLANAYDKSNEGSKYAQEWTEEILLQ
jgi:hypothetical protein